MHLIHPAVVGEQKLEEVSDEVDGHDPQHGGKEQSAQVLAYWERVGVDAVKTKTTVVVCVLLLNTSEGTVTCLVRSQCN